MKKKIICCVLVIAVFFVFPLIAFAQGKGSTAINVKAKYIGKMPYISVFQSGRAEIKVKDANFSFTCEIADGTKIAVIPVTEEDVEALKWLKSILHDEDTLLHYYIVLFRNGEEIPTPSPLRVEISFNDSKFKPRKLVYVSDSSEKTEIKFTQSKDTISFNLQKAGYYIFVSNFTAINDVPKTGEPIFSIWVAWVLMSVSSLLLLALSFSHLKKKTSNRLMV